ncbi:MAG: hypothetical protein Q9205_006845 [Flavoplaca limonia]
MSNYFLPHVFLRTYETAMVRLREREREVTGKHKYPIKFEQISWFKIAYPQPVPSVRMSCLSRPDLLDLPQVKKWEEEDGYLSRLLMDMSLDGTVSKVVKEINRDRKTPAVDELTKGLYHLRREGEVSPWIVIGARVLLDIRDIWANTCREPIEIKS